MQPATYGVSVWVGHQLQGPRLQAHTVTVMDIISFVDARGIVVSCW
jgi:hypothetical protein